MTAPATSRRNGASIPASDYALATWWVWVSTGAAADPGSIRVDDALAAVGAQTLADRPIHRLSGGEQQRVRIAQALAADPLLLLCDEPLLSLDLNHQDAVVRLIAQRRREHDTAVLFVTHEINPVLRYVDKVLYLAQGQFKLGSVEEVMTSDSLTALYGSPVEVVRSGGRILVAGAPLARPGTDIGAGITG